MKDLRYLRERDWFSNFAFQVFREYFPSRSALDRFVDSIAADEEKSRFLKVASFYKFLVKDGRFSVAGAEEAKYFDETYRFLAICALIEWAAGLGSEMRRAICLPNIWLSGRYQHHSRGLALTFSRRLQAWIERIK